MDRRCKTQCNSNGGWLRYLLTPEDTTPGAVRPAYAHHCQGPVVEFLKSLLWLVLPIVLGLALGWR